MSRKQQTSISFIAKTFTINVIHASQKSFGCNRVQTFQFLPENNNNNSNNNKEQTKNKNERNNIETKKAKVIYKIN